MNDREGMQLRKFLPKRGTCDDSLFKALGTRTEWLSSGELERASSESALLFGAREACLRRIGHAGAIARATPGVNGALIEQTGNLHSPQGHGHQKVSA